MTIITISIGATKEGQMRAHQSTARARKHSERLIGSIHQKCGIPATTKKLQLETSGRWELREPKVTARQILTSSDAVHPHLSARRRVDVPAIL